MVDGRQSAPEKVTPASCRRSRGRLALGAAGEDAAGRPPGRRRYSRLAPRHNALITIFPALVRLHQQMDQALRKQWMMAQQDQQISEAISRDESRLRNFIRKRVADPGDAEDVLQDVFYELVELYRMMKPVEQVTAWMFRVARNRITDLFRKKQREGLRDEPAFTEDGEVRWLEELLPSPDAGPEAAYARSVLAEELDDALDELPDEQREVFIAHELMGYSFKELASRAGISVNTLLSRKHYAVLHLRQRLQAIYDEYRKA
jgi:RNA polymerase sigma factor (sigma-70 family)